MFAASCGAHLSSLATYPPGLPFAISILGTDQEKLVVLGLAGKEARPEVEVLELVAVYQDGHPGSVMLELVTMTACKVRNMLLHLLYICYRVLAFVAEEVVVAATTCTVTLIEGHFCQ